jgi:hypothetical protein
VPFSLVFTILDEATAGTALFVGLVNVDASTLEEPPFYGATAADQLAIANGFADFMTDLSFSLDGKAVSNIGVPKRRVTLFIR